MKDINKARALFDKLVMLALAELDGLI